MYADKEADIDEVAKDLRNQAPTVLFVCCCDSEAAMRMQTALSKDAVNKTRGEGGKGAVNKTRGDGEKGQGQQARASKEEFQVMFKCVILEELIIAGRHSIVKDVEIKQVLRTPGGGPLLIAEVGFSVAIQQMLSLRVAALCVHDQVEAGGGGAQAWGDVAQAFQKQVGAVDSRRAQRQDFDHPAVVAHASRSQSMRGGAVYRQAEWYSLARVLFDVVCGARGPHQEIGNPRWRGLQIVDVVAGGEDDDTGLVEFRASYLTDEGIAVLHERSRFVREGGRGFYLDGDDRAD